MRRRPILESACLLVLWAGAASAAPLRVTVELAGPVAGETRATGALLLTPLGKEPGTERLAVESSFPGEQVFDLPESVSWEIAVRVDGYWAAPAVLPAGTREAAVRMRLLPTGTLQARLVPAAGEEIPSSLALRFQSAPPRPGAAEAFEGTVSCPVEPGGLLRCEAPAGRLDLRLRSDAHVPVYLWGVEVRGGRTTEAGELRLQRGASVSGWAKTEGDGLLSAECRVELAADTSGAPTNLRIEERLQRAAQEVRPNEQGFFQLAGVAPGRYTLKVSQPGFATVSVSGIEVREGLEAQILDPIVLARPVTFALALDPGVEPYGELWKVRLVRRSSPADPPGDTFQARATPEGTCSIPNVPAGTYELSVLGADNSIWHSEMLEVAAGRLPHMVQIPVLRLDGLVTRGGEPLASTIWLGRNGRRLRFDSDGEGRFQGLLPEEGAWTVALTSTEEGWRVSLAAIDVQVPDGKSTARVEIAVPDTTLEGEVVDEAGRPVFAALVSAFSSTRTDSRVRTDREGKFAIHGLPAGPVTLSAVETDRESGWVQTALMEGEGAPRLRLVVRRWTKARGRVLSPSGGLPGVTLLAWPASQPASRVTTAMSGPGGDFELELPEGESALQVLVLPPGFAFRIAAVRLDPGRPVEIAVEPHGGTLILEGAAAEPLLVHEGIVVPLQPLRDWARMQGAPSSDPGRLVIPNVAGGAYNLCKGRVEASAAACSTGVLSPLGELVLRAPE